MKKFEDFPTGNESGRFLVNPYWLEHLLNLFFQGYLGEVWEEVIDTEKHCFENIENMGFGIIAQNLDKTQSPPTQTSKSKILTFSKAERDLISIKEENQK